MILNDIPLGFMQGPQAAPLMPSLPAPAMAPPVAPGPSSAYDRMIRMNRGHDSISAGTKRAMERDQNRARIFRERREAIQRTGNLPTYHDHTPEQDLDALKYGVPLGPYQFNMPGPGTSPALANKLARADAALANTMTQGTPKQRANPGTRQYTRFRNMLAADAMRPVQRPVVREWDQALMDKIHNRNTRAPMVDEAANDPLVKDVLALDDHEGGQGFMAVPAEARGGKAEVGSPAFKRMQRMQKKVARATGGHPENVTQEDIDDFLADKRDASQKYNKEVERDRRSAVTKKAAERATLRRNGGQKQNGDPFQNLANYAAMTNNPEMMQIAVSGMNAGADRKLREKEITNEGDKTAALLTQGKQQHEQTMAQLKAAETAAEQRYKLETMKGNNEAAAQAARDAQAFQMAQAHLATAQAGLEEAKRGREEASARNKPLTRDEYATSISNNHTPEEVKQLLDEWDNSHAAPAGAGAAQPQSRVERDMAAGKLTDEVYNEMRALHPADLWHPDWNPFVGEEPYKEKLFRHFNNLYPNVPPAMMKALIGRYFIRHRNE